MIIQKEDIVLRQTTPDDKDLQSLLQTADELSVLSELRLYPEALPTEIAFRIEKEDVLLGEIRLKAVRWFNRKAELSIVVSPKYQNKGIGGKAFKALIEYAFLKMNLHRLSAEVIEYNKASIKMVENLGFKLEGTFREAKYSNGKYWNIFSYGILRDEFLK